MNILNTIIDYSGGVESRFEVECELLILHLLDVVAVSPLSHSLTTLNFSLLPLTSSHFTRRTTT